MPNILSDIRFGLPSLVLALLLFCQSGPSAANVVLLASFWGGSASGQTPESSATAAVGLGFASDDMDNPSCIGCASYLYPGQSPTLTLNFTAATGAAFSEFAPRLTDQQDEQLGTYFFDFDSTGTSCCGASFAGAYLESETFGSLLSPGTTIERVQVTFDQYRFIQGGTYHFSPTWQIFGVPSPIPEPRAWAMILCGLSIVVMRARQPALSKTLRSLLAGG